MNQRLISFGYSTISIEYRDHRPELVDLLFQDIPPATSDDPWALLRLEEQPDENRRPNDHSGERRYRLWQNESLLTKDKSFANMAYHLMSQVCYTLAYDSRAGLLLHSAAVQLHGQGIMLPGKTGAGKSTLTAWLLSRGGRYLTDELVYVAAGGHALSGFSRPISIKSAGRHLLPRLLVGQPDAGGQLQAEPVDMIHSKLFGAEVLAGDSTLDLIIFPTYRPDHETEMRRLSPALAAFELMKCLANARNLPGHGLSEAVRLAGVAPAYTLSYADLQIAGRSITRLLKSEPGDPLS